MRQSREELEQTFLFRWITQNSEKHEELQMLFHIPNGGYRLKSEAKRLKASGVKSGVPDLFLAVPKGEYSGLFIEMKTVSGKTSKQQKEWLEKLNKQGYLALVCRGWIEAVQQIVDYLQLDVEF